MHKVQFNSDVSHDILCGFFVSEKDHDCISGDKIQTEVLVRNSVHIFKSLSNSRKMPSKTGHAQKREWFHKQMKISEVLMKLRRREVNVLIATCELVFH